MSKGKHIDKNVIFPKRNIESKPNYIDHEYMNLGRILIMPGKSVLLGREVTIID